VAKSLIQIVPFGNYIGPKLDFSSVASSRGIEENARNPSFAINPLRLKQQVIYFSVTGQVLQAVEEYFLPWITRKFFSEAKRITHIGDDNASLFDCEQEKTYLFKVRQEIELPEYEIYEDYAEMVVQVRLIYFDRS